MVFISFVPNWAFHILYPAPGGGTKQSLFGSGTSKKVLYVSVLHQRHSPKNQHSKHRWKIEGHRLSIRITMLCEARTQANNHVKGSPFFSSTRSNGEVRARVATLVDRLYLVWGSTSSYLRCRFRDVANELRHLAVYFSGYLVHVENGSF